MQHPIVHTPRTWRLGPVDGAEVLRPWLIEREQATVHEVLTDPSEVRLDAYGCLPGGFRLTPLALRQLCGLAAGLHNFVTDVGGFYREPDHVDGTMSPELAINAINEVTRLRFWEPKGLAGRKLIKNTHTNTVDGIVGRSYKYLSNHGLLDSAAEMMAMADPPAVFYSSMTVGRRIGLAFRCENPLLHSGHTSHERCDIYAGYYFSNSEAGECSVRAAPLLQLGVTPCRCLGYMRHLAHSGRKFGRKLGRILSGVLMTMEEWHEVRDKVTLSWHQPIKSQLQAEITQPRLAQIVGKLKNAGIPQAAAEHILKSALHDQARGYGTDKLLRNMAPTDRTAYDLVLRLAGRAERRSQLKEREIMEHVAFRLLTGSLSI